MADITFDAAKLMVVRTEEVYPNSWNPKPLESKELGRVIKSVKTNGLRAPIVVRQREVGYEIIDGQQRWTACRHLGYEKVVIYNEGVVADKLAQELTIWYQQQVPFSQVEEAFLVNALVEEFGRESVNLPYDEAELSALAALATYSFDSNEEALNLPQTKIQLVLDFDSNKSRDDARIALTLAGYKVR